MGEQVVWKFDELPEKGKVAADRVPYSGYIYLDTQGGTASALRKYDYAYHDGRMLATAHENWDTTAFKEPTARGGLLGRSLGLTTMRTPNWHGHCNGWAAAAIRHAEPQKAVKVNDVVFTPADIKGLLAELYLYNDTLHLAGITSTLDAGTFHAVLGNWLGRGLHPLGMESDPSDEKWNYPVYAYACNSAKRSNNRVEVKLNLVYAKDSDDEYQESPRIQKVKYFHYTLQLNGAGEIVGGQFHNDSSIIDMLWVPLQPKASGQPGHERGNPYIDVRRILAIWRASVPEEKRRDWFVIDPAKEDRIHPKELVWGRRILPVQDPNANRAAEAAANAADPDDRTAARPETASPVADEPSGRYW